MGRTLALVVVLLIGVGAAPRRPLASSILAEAASGFVGTTEIVCGDASVTDASPAKGDPIAFVLKSGDDTRTLAATIPAGNRSRFSPLLTTHLEQRQICVEGKIEAGSTAANAAMRVSSPDQFKFVGSPHAVPQGFGLGAVRCGEPGLTPPKPTKEVKPQYSSDAIRRHLQGTVDFEAVIEPDGRIRTVKMVESIDILYGLDDKAMAAGLEWKFQPGVVNGRPVPVLVMLEMNYALRAPGSADGPVVQSIGWDLHPPGEGACAPAKTPAVADDSGPKILKRAAVHYPIEALRAGWQGEVALTATVDAGGRVSGATVERLPVDAPTGVAEAATDTAKRWTFQPARLKGAPVQSMAPIVVRFKFR